MEQDNEKDSVIVVMGPSSEPEAGFDPAYGVGRGGNMSMSADPEYADGNKGRYDDRL